MSGFAVPCTSLLSLKIVLTYNAAPCFGFANHSDWFRWFAVSNSHLSAVLFFPVLWVGAAKKLITKLGCEKYFGRFTY
jgi:hypothetical protein